MSWILLALLSAATAGAATVTNKYVFIKLSKEPMLQVIAAGLVGATLSTLITVLHGPTGSLSGGHILIALGAGVAFGLSLITTMHAIRIGDVSQVGPLRMLTPVFVAMLAVLFLGETLSFKTYAGVALVVAGAALLDKKPGVRLHFNKVLIFMTLSGLMIATMQILTKYLLRYSDPYTILLYVRLGLLAFTIPLLIAYFKMVKEVIMPDPLRNLALLVVPGLFGTSGMFLLMFASEKGPVTVASTLASATPFFILLYIAFLGRRFPDVYAEKSKGTDLRRRGLLTAIMFIGVALII